MGTRTALLALLIACSGEDPDPRPKPVDDPIADIYATAVPEEGLVELTLDGQTVEVAEDQLLVVLDEGADRSGFVDALDGELGGAVLGQLGELGVYQVQLEADDASSFEAAIEAVEALDGVLGATYHPRLELLADIGGVCDPPDDLLRIEDVTKSPGCAIAELDYRGLAVTWDALGDIPLTPVRVAVVDTGIALGSGAFDDLRHEKLVPGETHTIKHPHGTWVAGIIAADDLDDHTNGIASRFLGDKLTVVSRPVGGLGAFSTLVDMHRAAVVGADIVNVSMGHFVLTPGPQPLEQFMYERVVDGYPETLFVAAAGNEGDTLGSNIWPAALDRPNTLTVGGTADCSLNLGHAKSNTGPRVHVAAPYTMPVLDYHPVSKPKVTGTKTLGGTSFSAPVVSSVAAILSSINPALSGADLKERITRQAWFTNMPVRHGFVVPATPIFEALYQEVPTTRDTIAPGGSLFTIGALAEGLLCGESTIEVKGEESLTFSGDEVVAFWDSTGVNVAFIAGEQSGFALLFTGHPALSAPYSIPGNASLGVGWPVGDFLATVVAQGGSLSLEGCIVTARRTDGSNEPEWVRITLEGQGPAIALLPGQTHPVQRDMRASIQVGALIPNDTDQATLSHIDTVCGGAG